MRRHPQGLWTQAWDKQRCPKEGAGSMAHGHPGPRPSAQGPREGNPRPAEAGSCAKSLQREARTLRLSALGPGPRLLLNFLKYPSEWGNLWGGGAGPRRPLPRAWSQAMVPGHGPICGTHEPGLALEPQLDPMHHTSATGWVWFNFHKNMMQDRHTRRAPLRNAASPAEGGRLREELHRCPTA